MRLRPVPITAGIMLLVLALLAIPASAATGTVTIYGSSRRVQTISNPAAGRCLQVAEVRIARVLNQTRSRIELHRTDTCRLAPAAVVGPRQGRELPGLRAIRARG